MHLCKHVLKSVYVIQHAIGGGGGGNIGESPILNKTAQHWVEFFYCLNMATATVDDQSTAETFTMKPTCIICLGMAGSGKTTFVQVRYILLPRQTDHETTHVTSS